MRKYSFLQMYRYSTGDYRVKDFVNNKWINIKRSSGNWIFLDKSFSTANKLNQHIREINNDR